MEYSDLIFEKNDKLQRKQFVKNIMSVIEGWDNHNSENNSIVIALDAPWGSGKSYLLNMWMNFLKSEGNYKEKYFMSYYNAWENDDCDNAFIPLVYNLKEMYIYGRNDEVIDSIKKKSQEFIKYCGVALLKDAIKKTIGEETSKILTEGVDAAAKKNPEGFFKKYETYISKKEEFRTALTDLIPDDGKLIIFVDELDRCRPTFAIETLEIVKHYFNIKDIVFVFAVDLEQLSHSIKTMYGNGMDSEGYLRRFFDININIPSGDFKQYIRFKVENYMSERGITEGFINRMGTMYTKLGLSLRDIDKITNSFLIFYLFYNSEIMKQDTDKIENILECYLYFITLKYKYPSIYHRVIKEDFISYDDSPKNWPILEEKYFVSKHINEMLRNMQVGNSRNKDTLLIGKYGIPQVNGGLLSFSEHIERTIEMFK